jgi:serine/threonine protein kinase
MEVVGASFEPVRRAVTRKVGGYELLRELGRGGMAVVYLARQLDLDRFVAVKELASFRRDDPTIARRFVRESRLAGSLTHPNIVTVYDYFEHEGTPYIAMEYVEHGSLRPYLGHMTLPQIGGVLEGTLAGLAYAEERSIVHRDLKPENLMVTAEGRVKIADFGIAKATDTVGAASVLTQAGMTVGTPPYMAPEQAMNLDIGPWTDLYSLGCVAFEIFAGRVPFDDAAPMSVLLKHINEKPPPLASLVGGIDPELAAWVDRLLIKDVAQRPRSAAEVWDALEEILLRMLGPRWRRQARLTTPDESPGTDIPLTPAPFQREAPPAESTGFGTAADEYETFHAPPPPRPPVITPSESLVPAPPPLTAASKPVAPPSPPPVAPPPPAPESAPPPAPPPSLATTLPPTWIPEPPPVPPARHRRRALPIVILVAVLLAVAAAVLLRGRGADAPSPAPRATASAAPAATVVEAGPLRLTVPAGWRRASVRLDELRLTRAVALAPAGDVARGAVVAGLADASAHRSSLLPDGLVDSLGLRRGVVPDRTVERLSAGLSAYRYGDLRPLEQGRTLTVYSVPTTAGVATVACVHPAAGAPAACEQIARSLALAGEQPFPLGPSRDYAARVDAAVTRLDRTVADERAGLRSAGTPARQGRAARAIAAAHRRARAALAGELSPADEESRERLAAALRAAESGWSRLASAASGDRAPAYASARRATARAQAQVVEALSALRADGYQQLLTTRYRTAAIPRLARVEPSTQALPTATAQPRATAQAPRATAVPPQPTAQPRRPEPTPPPIEGD